MMRYGVPIKKFTLIISFSKWGEEIQALVKIVPNMVIDLV